jgi:hypothetical protein
MTDKVFGADFTNDTNPQPSWTISANDSTQLKDVALTDVLSAVTHNVASKATPVDADELPLVDSAASNVLKKLTFANLKATLLAYFRVTPINPGYIQENSAQLLYVGAQAYSVLPGSADVNGTVITWGSNIARTGLTLTANTLYYVYLYSNSGTPAVEESTTVPVWDSALNYFKKTGDATRRCIGFIEASATNTIRNFLTVAVGRYLELYYNDGVVNLDRTLVNAQTSPTNWTSFSLAPYAPAHATHVNMLVKMIGITLGDDGIIGVNPTDLGSSVAPNSSINFWRGRASAAAANVFFGSAWLPMVTPQTYYYKTQAISGTPSAEVDILGARILR